MMAWIQIIAMVGALVVFALAAANVQVQVTPNLVALGLTLLTLALLLGGIPPLLPAAR